MQSETPLYNGTSALGQANDKGLPFQPAAEPDAAQSLVDRAVRFYLLNIITVIGTQPDLQASEQSVAAIPLDCFAWGNQVLPGHAVCLTNLPASMEAAAHEPEVSPTKQPPA